MGWQNWCVGFEMEKRKCSEQTRIPQLFKYIHIYTHFETFSSHLGLRKIAENTENGDFQYKHVRFDNYDTTPFLHLGQPQITFE